MFLIKNLYLMNKKTIFIKKKVYLLLFTLLVLSFFTGLLKGPVVPNDIQSKNCARNVVLPFNGGITLNCDSGMYIRLAKNPSLLFEDKRYVNNRNLTPGNVEQATPGSTFLVWLISQPIIFIWKDLDKIFSKSFSEVKKSLNKTYDQQDIDQTIEDSFPDFTSFLPSYLSHIIFHFILILLSFFLYIKILNKKTLDSNNFIKPFFWIGSFILINDIVKQFFFSPGPQLFRIFSPIITVYFSMKILESKNVNKEFFKGSLIIGIGMLFYYNFIISMLTIGFAWVFKKRPFYNPLNFIKKEYLNFLFSIFIFCLPFFIWYMVCLLLNNELFIYDLNQKNNGIDVFKSIFKEKGLEGLYEIIFKSIYFTYKRSLIHSWHILILMFTMLFLLKFKLTYREKNLLRISTFYSIFIILFFAFYKPLDEPRLVFSAFLIFLPFVGELSKRIIGFNKYLIIFVFLVSTYAVYVVYKIPPYGWYHNDGYYFFER